MNVNNMDILGVLLQALSLQILFQDYNNSDLMQELQRQNIEYLEKIIAQNNKILEKLEGGNYEGNRNVRKDKE